MTEPRFAYAHRIRQHGIEHGIQITGRGADELEHVGGGGLLLQGFAQFVEQARVLDGNDSLTGKARNQRDLLLGKRSNLLVKNADCPEQLIVPDHRHDEQSPDAANFDASDRQWVVIEIGLIVTIVDDVNNLRSLDDSGDRVVRTWLMRALLEELGEGGRVVEIRDESHHSMLEPPQRPKMRAADAGSILQHRSEHRLQLAGRSADDLEHVGGRGLLLERFAQLVEQPRVLYGDDGLAGKAREQRDLFIAEGPDLLAVDVDCTKHIGFFQHWYG